MTEAKEAAIRAQARALGLNPVETARMLSLPTDEMQAGSHFRTPGPALDMQPWPGEQPSNHRPCKRVLRARACDPLRATTKSS